MTNSDIANVKLLISVLKNTLVSYTDPQNEDAKAILNLLTRIIDNNGTASNSPGFRVEDNVFQTRPSPSDEWTDLVDFSTLNFLPLTGGTMQGNIDMGGHEINNAIIDGGTL
jgi:hypothetical protein